MNDISISIFISIIIIIILITKSHIYIRHSFILHSSILLFIVFLFYAKYPKSALMTSVLYLIVYIQSYKILESYTADNSILTQQYSLQDNDAKKSTTLLRNDNLPTQMVSWYSGDSFHTLWNDLSGNSNHIQLGTALPTIKTGTFKWVSGDVNTQIKIPEKAWRFADSDSITFIHLTRYNPRSDNRGKLWTALSGSWISGYDDNKLTFINVNGTELPMIGGDKNGDIMNIRGSNWNIVIDQMDITNKLRTVNVNRNDYVFQGILDSIPSFVGLNIQGSNKSDWECAACMVYPRILSQQEILKIHEYFNKKYMLVSLDKIDKTVFNIYNHSSFVNPSNNSILGTTESEYGCVSLCNTQTPTCPAFTYDMTTGVCYSVPENNILNHTTQLKSFISGTNKIREDAAIKAKEEAERLAREAAIREQLRIIEAARQERIRQQQEAERQEAARQEAIRQEAARQEAIRQEQIRQQQQEAARQEAVRQQQAYQQQVYQQQEYQRQVYAMQQQQAQQAQAQEAERQAQAQREQNNRWRGCSIL